MDLDNWMDESDEEMQHTEVHAFTMGTPEGQEVKEGDEDCQMEDQVMTGETVTEDGCTEMDTQLPDEQHFDQDGDGDSMDEADTPTSGNQNDEEEEEATPDREHIDENGDEDSMEEAATPTSGDLDDEEEAATPDREHFDDEEETQNEPATFNDITESPAETVQPAKDDHDGRMMKYQQNDDENEGNDEKNGMTVINDKKGDEDQETPNLSSNQQPMTPEIHSNNQDQQQMPRKTAQEANDPMVECEDPELPSDSMVQCVAPDPRQRIQETAQNANESTVLCGAQDPQQKIQKTAHDANEYKDQSPDLGPRQKMQETAQNANESTVRCRDQEPQQKIQKAAHDSNEFMDQSTDQESHQEISEEMIPPPIASNDNITDNITTRLATVRLDQQLNPFGSDSDQLLSNKEFMPLQLVNSDTTKVTKSKVVEVQITPKSNSQKTDGPELLHLADNDSKEPGILFIYLVVW